MIFLILILCLGAVVFVMFFQKSTLCSTCFSKPYFVSMELDHLDVLEEIEPLLIAFRLKLKDKVLVREDGIRLDLRYKAHPIAQHLFLKRIYSMPNVGKIVSL